MKEKYAPTELAKLRNRYHFLLFNTFDGCRLAFGVEAEDEIGYTGVGLGMIGKAGPGSRLRLIVNQNCNCRRLCLWSDSREAKVQKKIQKQTKAYGGSSGATSGLASSLAFTPVQGLELENPQAQAEKLKQLNAK